MAKPRIWGHCAAGCEWEVPHKGDFDAYRKVSSRFPEPTLNAEKKLVESGYYYIEIGGSSTMRIVFGIVRFEGNILYLPSATFAGNSANPFHSMAMSVGADGSMKIEEFKISSSGVTSTEDATGTYNIYTAKITDVELPELAEGEAY